MTKRRDHSLELLTDLDGLSFAQEGGYWIKYEVSTVEKTAERPHGTKYSLTLHNPQGERILELTTLIGRKSEVDRPPGQRDRTPRTIYIEAGECTTTNLGMRKRSWPILTRVSMRP